MWGHGCFLCWSSALLWTTLTASVVCRSTSLLSGFLPTSFEGSCTFGLQNALLSLSFFEHESPDLQALSPLRGRVQATRHLGISNGRMLISVSILNCCMPSAASDLDSSPRKRKEMFAHTHTHIHYTGHYSWPFRMHICMHTRFTYTHAQIRLLDITDEYKTDERLHDATSSCSLLVRCCTSSVTLYIVCMY